MTHLYELLFLLNDSYKKTKLRFWTEESTETSLHLIREEMSLIIIKISEKALKATCLLGNGGAVRSFEHVEGMNMKLKQVKF